MCLETKQFFSKRATEDIPIFKVVKKEDGIYKSPTHLGRRFIWTLNQVAKSRFDFRPSWSSYTKTWSINRGLHTFTSTEAARRYFTNIFDNDFRLLAGIIPKGARYFMSSNQKEIAANRVILQEDTGPLF